MRRCLLALAALTACSSNDTPAMIDAPGQGTDAPGAFDAVPDSPPAAFVLTSSMLTEGGMINAANTCDGANTSPPLAWTGAPSNAAGFAVILTDKTNGLIHAVIYDIPATVTMLPANVEKAYAPANVPGAHQTTSYQAAVRGYNGPCPPPGMPHTYELALYALDQTPLANASMSTMRTAAYGLAMQHMIAVTKLTGTYTR